MNVLKTLTSKSLVKEFFLQCQGQWKSQRRYYTLQQEGEPQEVTSILTIEFLPSANPELKNLAQLHSLDGDLSFWCGSKVTWQSQYTNKLRKPSCGATVFGVVGDILYRDQGFATTKPVVASYYFTDPKTFCLKTEYHGSVFEEEIKLIGSKYRSRQTIISKAGEELMIGQYLETKF
jgi:hypothetical protein